MASVSDPIASLIGLDDKRFLVLGWQEGVQRETTNGLIDGRKRKTEDPDTRTLVGPVVGRNIKPNEKNEIQYRVQTICVCVILMSF